MEPRRRRLEGGPARRRISASALSTVALIAMAACGQSSGLYVEDSLTESARLIRVELHSPAR